MLMMSDGCHTTEENLLLLIMPLQRMLNISANTIAYSYIIQHARGELPPNKYCV